MGKGKYHIIGCKLDCPGEHVSGYVVMAGLESLDGVSEVDVGKCLLVRFFGCFLRKPFANICKSSVVNGPNTRC